jgi:cytolysin (calcineurin-like family phosphatase)
MSEWWTEEAKNRFHQAVEPYNVVCLVHGHSHGSGPYVWRGLQVLADGSTARPERPPGDFFVVRVTRDELILAGREDGQWKSVLRKKIAPPASQPASGPGRN